ncbi:hypothetical protein VT03_22340 [Planctomyces sp. SH-PL14]|nr:hypothetical protein VT03_22340 [Planctomyces sp. SH-PL14]
MKPGRWWSFVDWVTQPGMNRFANLSKTRLPPESSAWWGHSLPTELNHSHTGQPHFMAHITIRTAATTETIEP